MKYEYYNYCDLFSKIYKHFIIRFVWTRNEKILGIFFFSERHFHVGLIFHILFSAENERNPNNIE